jgi:tyrosyl-tRNA synthetase
MTTTNANSAAIDELLTRGVETVEVESHLRQRIQAGEQLRIKLGVDPTAPDLHLGHAVVLRKLAQWQQLGHQVILLIGDFTATIGDPSGRNDARPMLSPQQIEDNWKSYQEQVSSFLDMSKVEVRRNGEWYSHWSLAQLLELYSKFTVSRVLERDDFTKRMQSGGELSMLELAYPMLQGYDSFELHADVEMGGSDQLFNMLMGRKVQKRLGSDVQDVIATPLLEGTDGVRKMGKSYGNYIALREPAPSMFGKLMSVPDELIIKYLTLLTALPMTEVEKYRQQLEGGTNPKEVKIIMATAVVATIHGDKEAASAAERFDSVHSRGQIPEDMPTVSVASIDNLVDLLVASKLVPSKTEARRLIEQGAVRIDSVIATNVRQPAPAAGAVLRVGPTRYCRLVP